MLTTRFLISIFLVAMMVVGAGVASGQNYPNKPIRFYVGGAGGGNDATARLIAQGITGPLGQPVIVENRNSVALALPIVSQLPPDGYALVLAGDLIWLAPLLQNNLPWDPVRDFSPVTIAARGASVLVVHPSLPVKSVKELIALAKARPGELNYGSVAAGGLDHIGMELFKSMAGVSIVRVGYKAGGPAIVGVVSGEVQMRLPSVSTVSPEIKSGRLRALAVASLEPSALFPDLPTMANSGLPGYEIVTIDGIYTTAKTPAAIVNQLNREIVRFIRTPEATAKYLSLGAEIVGSSPEEHAAILKSRIAVIGKVIKDAGIRAE